MTLNHFKIIGCLLLSFLLLFSAKAAPQLSNEGHIKVSLRMIGHQLLLKNGDSNSRVLAIRKDRGRYAIPFEAEFAFKPADLVATVDSLIQRAQIAQHYLVEVVLCSGNEVVYSYEKGYLTQADVIPCGPRPQPKACYTIFITLLNGVQDEPALSSNKSFNSYYLLLLLAALVLVTFGLSYRRKKRKSNTNSNLISLGKFHFDKLNMILTLDKQRIELSSKEADLLNLLYDSANETLAREHILKVVWGDDGDYIGRTLDVFISKLRKKLEADPALKIINIRGIGYKLLLNAES